MKFDAMSSAADELRESAIYIDISTCLSDDLKFSGIPRTERNIVNHFLRLANNHEVICWDNDLQEYLVLDPAILEGNCTIADKQAFSRGLLSNVIWKEDTILLLGASWFIWGGVSSWLKYVRYRFHPKLVLLVYDLIALKLPALVNPSYAFKFGEGLKLLAGLADCLLGISRHSLKDLEVWLKENGIAVPKTGFLKLGDDTLFAWEKPSRSRSPVQDFIKNRKFILYVSGVNPRKNHRLLFEVWKRMLNDPEISDVPLLINLGMPSADSAPLMAELARDTLLKTHIGVFHGINDSALDWLYRNCLFTVFPSQYEGWGLPVAESLKYGKICIAADATSIPEIAPEQTDLIDPQDFISWYEKIKSYILDAGQRGAREKEVAAYAPFTWAQSAESLLHMAIQCDIRKADPPPILCGLQYGTQESPDQPIIFGKGWYLPELQGRWTEGRHAMLIMPVEKEGIYRLSFRAKAMVVKNSVSRTLTILCNGTHAGTLQITVPEQEYEVICHAEQNPASIPQIHLDLMMEDPISPFELDPQINDKRKLGIQISTLKLEFLPGRESRMEGNIIKLCKLLDDKDGQVRKLLSARPDLDGAMCEFGDYGYAFILFWLWNNTDFTDPIRIPLKAVLQQLHGTKISPLSSAYTALIDLVRHIRPDLQEHDPETKEGLISLLSWFYQSGINEYCLDEIISTPI